MLFRSVSQSRYEKRRKEELNTIWFTRTSNTEARWGTEIGYKLESAISEEDLILKVNNAYNAELATLNLKHIPSVAVASIESAPTDDLSGLDDMFDSGAAIVTPKAENLPTGEPVTTKTSTFDFNSYLIPPGVDAAELGIESSITDPDSIEDLGDIIRRQCNPGG